jgi:DNA-binding transcriptional MocR family regulator
MTQKDSPVHLKATQMTGRPVTWAQINLAASEDLRGLISRQPKAAQLILALIEKMEPGGGGVVVASRTTMSELIDASIATVRRALSTLTEEGWVQRIRIGGVSALAINHRVAWVGPRADIQHAVFGATVIASRSEQDAFDLSPPPTRRVPMLRPGELPLMFGQVDPPSQPDLDGMPPVVARMADADGVIPDEHIARLEAAGQLRITELEST